MGSHSAVGHPQCVSGAHASSGAGLKSVTPGAQSHMAHGVQPLQGPRCRTLVPHALVTVIKLRRMLNSADFLHLPS